jgi:hypothetical protein
MLPQVPLGRFKVVEGVAELQKGDPTCTPK